MQFVLGLWELAAVKFKQFAALPFRTREDDLEILLITTRKKRRWPVPKGWPIKRAAPHETAVIEHTRKPACGQKSAGSRSAASESVGKGKISLRCVKSKSFRSR